ncbi:MAG: hypothetical protein RBT47_08360 [Anaerolineae bacterium]|jgi:dihydroorotate dehydrogenase electron transfer subunit|nr:hypothetical protein [Anaerolineae bacterium]
MIKRQQALFREAHPAPPFWSVRFELPSPPTAGRFMLADLGGPLREVLFPATFEEGSFAVLVAPGHPATRLLPGTPVDMIGPLGHGFDIADAARLLLVADAAHLPPLLPLLQAAPTVSLLVEAPTRALLPPAGRFPTTVELHLLTHDGSGGHAGTLEDESSPLPSLLQWAERVCLSCPRERYPALAEKVEAARLHPAPRFAQALVQVPMPCGVGACEICRIETRQGERHACTEGPVFDLLTLREG